jgi:hypothetical protein
VKCTADVSEKIKQCRESPRRKTIIIIYPYHHLEVHLMRWNEILQMTAMIRVVSSGDYACDNERITGCAAALSGKGCVRYQDGRMPQPGQQHQVKLWKN